MVQLRFHSNVFFVWVCHGISSHNARFHQCSTCSFFRYVHDLHFTISYPEQPGCLDVWSLFHLCKISVNVHSFPWRMLFPRILWKNVVRKILSNCHATFLLIQVWRSGLFLFHISSFPQLCIADSHGDGAFQILVGVDLLDLWIMCSSLLCPLTAPAKRLKYPLCLHSSSTIISENTSSLQILKGQNKIILPKSWPSR